MFTFYVHPESIADLHWYIWKFACDLSDLSLPAPANEACQSIMLIPHTQPT